MKLPSLFKNATSFGIVIGTSDGPASFFVGKKSHACHVPAENVIQEIYRAVFFTAAAFGILLCLVKLVKKSS